MPECFTLVYVRQMHFDKRNIDRGERVGQCHAGVRVRGGVDDDEIGGILSGSLDAVYQLTFVIALEKSTACAMLLCHLLQAGIDVCEGLPAINSRLTGAEQVEVRTIQNQNILHHYNIFMKTNRLFTLNSRICP